jgi:hypothetical protein
MRKKKKEKKTQVGVEFEPASLTALDNYCGKHGLGRAPAVRMIVLNFLDQMTRFSDVKEIAAESTEEEERFFYGGRKHEVDTPPITPTTRRSAKADLLMHKRADEAPAADGAVRKSERSAQ